MNNIETCPHCGFHGVLNAESKREHTEDQDLGTVSRLCVTYWIECGRCGACGPKSHVTSSGFMNAPAAVDAVVTMWNRRPKAKETGLPMPA